MKPQFPTRIKALRSHMLSEGVDALLVFSLDNLRYLCNFTGEAGFAVLTPHCLFLFTDYRFIEQAHEECVDAEIICRVRDKQSVGQAIAQVLQRNDVQRVAFEAQHITVQEWQAVLQVQGKQQFIASSGLVEQLRRVKDAWEVEQIRSAAQIADLALAQVLPILKPGISERTFALALELHMQQLGADGLSFPTIVGFGARSALPHCVPSSRTLQRGDLVVIDFGAVVHGYRSDMTRSFVAGQASSRQQAMFDTVLAAQNAALQALCDDLPAASADLAASSVLQASEFAKYAGPGLGHGLGIKLHEQPFMGPDCSERLQAGYVVTIEPGVYIPGYGGLRLEDDVLITARGYSLLTHAPKVFELPI